MLQVMTAGEFSEEVRLWIVDGGLGAIDAIVHVATKFGVEMESIKEMITPDLKTMVELEAMELNYLPKKARLPI
jgi:hypothetical protein